MPFLQKLGRKDVLERQTAKPKLKLVKFWTVTWKEKTKLCNSEN